MKDNNKKSLYAKIFSQVDTAELFTPVFSENSLEIMNKRHLLRDKSGKILEDPQKMFWRVASNMALEDWKYVKGADNRKQKAVLKSAHEFYKLMAENRFLPGSRVLFEAGNDIDGTGQLSSCFVLPVGDSLESIFETMKDAAIVQKNNGGTGFNFSHIRPKSDMVGGTPNVAAGPVHFIKSFSQSFDQILQGKKRGGGNMAILNVDHPDIIEFINLKGSDASIRNFNISVGVNDKFMEAVRNDADFDLINPRTGKVTKTVRALEIFDLICQKAWECADPGLFFLDTTQNANPTKPLGIIEATNPYGEEPLRAYESCNLGSMVLPSFLVKDKKDYKIDWDLLAKSVRSAIHFLENMIDLSRFPLDKINHEVSTTRKLGLGVVGFGSMLYKLHIAYNSNEATELTERIIAFIQNESVKESAELAKERGVFPGYKGSKWDEQGIKVRNATMTSIAPTGTLSLVADTSSGIEPIFSLVYKRKSFYQDDGKEERKELLYVNKEFEEYAKDDGFYSEELMEKIADNSGSLENITEVPNQAKKIFVTTHDIAPFWHVKMQAAAQKNVDAAVSKTINMPNEATVDDVKKAYIQAWESKCKGITIYRDGSKQFQVLETGNGKEQDTPDQQQLVIASSNPKKIGEIKEYLDKFTNFKVKKISSKKYPDDPFLANISEESLMDAAVKNAQELAEDSKILTLADETGFIYSSGIGIPKNAATFLYFGKNDDYSEKLFQLLHEAGKQKGIRGFIATAIAIANPDKGTLIKEMVKLPGKFIKDESGAYNFIFIHDILAKFDQVPDRNEFKPFHHRTQALTKAVINKY